MLSIIVPVYNGGTSLPELVELINRSPAGDFDNRELIFIDDGSTDSSLEVIKKLAEQDPRTGWISFKQNAGQQAAVLCGLRECRGDLIVTMDDDLQHPIEMIPVLVNELNRGYDAVYAIPDTPGRSGGKLRDAFFTFFLNKPSGLKIGSYRIFTRAAADRICEASQPFVYISAELFRHGLKAAAVKYKTPEPAASKGQSRYSFRGRLHLYIRLLRWYMPLIGAVSRRAAAASAEPADAASAESGCRQQYIIAAKGGCL